MAQEPSSSHPTPSISSSGSPVKSKARVKTKFAKKVHRILVQITEPIAVTGRFVFGEWWRPIVLSIQDAIAIGCFLWIPNHVFIFFSKGDDFSNLDACWKIGFSDPSIFACLGLVAGEYCFWMVFLGKTIAHFVNQIRSR